MGLKCGIVGLPNVGKSTLFNALTKAGIAAENYPFCTIEPNVGIVELPDPRLQALAAIVKPERVLPAIVEFVDIAGLVAGASKGEGLGNQFLSHIRETDAIAHVTGRKASLVASPGTYDQKHVARIAGVPHCVAYGPGDLAMAHQPDEYCSLDDIISCTKVLALAVLKLST